MSAKGKQGAPPPAPRGVGADERNERLFAATGWTCAWSDVVNDAGDVVYRGWAVRDGFGKLQLVADTRKQAVARTLLVRAMRVQRALSARTLPNDAPPTDPPTPPDAGRAGDA